MNETETRTNLIGNGAIRVTLPKAFCDPLDIKEGTVVLVGRVGKKITIRKKVE